MAANAAVDEVPKSAPMITSAVCSTGTMPVLATVSAIAVVALDDWISTVSAMPMAKKAAVAAQPCCGSAVRSTCPASEVKLVFRAWMPSRKTANPTKAWP